MPASDTVVRGIQRLGVTADLIVQSLLPGERHYHLIYGLPPDARIEDIRRSEYAEGVWDIWFSSTEWPLVEHAVYLNLTFHGLPLTGVEEPS